MLPGQGRRGPGHPLGSGQENPEERLAPEAPIHIEIGVALVEFGDAGVILGNQVDRMDPTAAHRPKQVILSGEVISWAAF